MESQSVPNHYDTIFGPSGDTPTPPDARIRVVISRLFGTVSNGTEQSRGQVTDTGVVWRWNVTRSIKYRTIVIGNTLGFHQNLLTDEFQQILSNLRC